MTIHSKLTPDLATPAITLDAWQYRLTAQPHPAARAVGAYWLTVGPGLPVIDVLSDQGSIGLLLGFPTDLQSKRRISGEWRAPSQAGSDMDERIHNLLRTLGGRYAFISTQKNRPRLYPDAVTGVSCVWDPLAKSAGSTAGAILSDTDYDARFDRALYRHLQIDGEGWFPAGLTAHKGVERLLPNHFLDLLTWTAHRFTAVPPAKPKPEDVIDGVIHTVQAQAKALLTGPKGLAIALTAGRDSRAVLACLKDMRDDLLTVTVTGADRHQTDTAVAQQLAKGFGLRHRNLPRACATRAAQDRFVRRGEHCYADSNKEFHPSVGPIAKTHVFAGGLGGEVGRAFYWSEADDPGLQVTPGLLVTRFGLRRSDVIEARLQDWLDHLPPLNDARDIFDLAYVEHRFGPWAMAQFCTDPTLERYSPMVSYDAVRLLLDLPHDWKAQEKLNEAIVARMWPELNSYPYNTLGPWGDRWIQLQRVAADPKILLKKLRQRRGAL